MRREPFPELRSGGLAPSPYERRPNYPAARELMTALAGHLTEQNKCLERRLAASRLATRRLARMLRWVRADYDQESDSLIDNLRAVAKAVER